MFGLTGGLIPCPAAIAALSVSQATRRWSGFSAFARRAPYFSSVLLIAVGIHVGLQGWSGLSAHASALSGC
jgi:nickel/cobalt exporter